MRQKISASVDGGDKQTRQACADGERGPPSALADIFITIKCRQKLCQRSKNLNQIGNCSICDDVIAEFSKNDENLKQNSSENVEVDLKLMINTHNKLVQGIPVDANTVSVLLLGGIINIINQHDKIENLEKKMKNVLMENNTNKIRLEMIENWVQIILSKSWMTNCHLSTKMELFSKKIMKLNLFRKTCPGLKQSSVYQNESLKRMQT